MWWGADLQGVHICGWRGGMCHLGHEVQAQRAQVGEQLSETVRAAADVVARDGVDRAEAGCELPARPGVQRRLRVYLLGKAIVCCDVDSVALGVKVACIGIEREQGQQAPPKVNVLSMVDLRCLQSTP